MEKKPTSSPEEIDLLYFFRPVGNAFRKTWNWSIDYMTVLAHNRFLFAVFLVLGAAAGYTARFIIPPSYKTEGIFISDMLPGRYCVTLLEGLNELRKPGNIPLLAKQLNISTDAAWQIQGLTASSSPKDTFAIEKRDTSMSVFQVGLVLHDMTHLDEIQKGLVDYLENNEYARMRKEARLNSYRLQIAALDAQQKGLDSARQLINTGIVPRSQGQGIILGEPISPVAVSQAEMSFMKERMYLQERVATINHIEILKPFFKLNEYNNPDYNKYLRYGLAAGFLLGLLVVWLVGRRPGPRPVRG